MDASLGKMPPTFVRRLISAINRSSGLVTGMISPGVSLSPPLAAYVVPIRAPGSTKRGQGDL